MVTISDSVGDVAITLVISTAIGVLIWTLTDLVKKITAVYDFMLKHKGEHDVLQQRMDQIGKSVETLTDNLADHKEDIDQRLDHHILVIQRNT